MSGEAIFFVFGSLDDSSEFLIQSCALLFEIMTVCFLVNALSLMLMQIPAKLRSHSDTL